MFIQRHACTDSHAHTDTCTQTQMSMHRNRQTHTNAKEDRDVLKWGEDVLAETCLQRQGGREMHVQTQKHTHG